MFRVQDLPMASEVLPMGNLTLTSVAMERTAIADIVCSCASTHRENVVRYNMCSLKFLEFMFVFVLACNNVLLVAEK